MEWKYQDTLSEMEAISNHLYSKKWDELSDDQRSRCLPLKGLLKEVERDFHKEFVEKLQKVADSHRRFSESASTI